MNFHRPFKKLQWRWAEGIGMPYCPYMYRWVFDFWFFSIRIHHWLRSDDSRAFHSHAWKFATIILKGGYTDVTPEGEEKLEQFSCKIRKASHSHYVRVPEGGCWSLLVCGRPKHKWGFLKDGKTYNKNKYFQKFGHPPCSEQ